MAGARPRSAGSTPITATCSEQFRASADHNLVPVDITDLAVATIRYAELRTESELATGAAKPFLTAYLLIAADKVGR